MASARERRAALQNRTITAELTEPQLTPSAIYEPNEEPPMKIKFTTIDLAEELPRMDGGKGQWSASSTRHTATDTCTIELDTATMLVRISNQSACQYVPLYGGVKRLGPTLDDAAEHAKAVAILRAEASKARAVAAAEAEATAQRPA